VGARTVSFEDVFVDEIRVKDASACVYGGRSGYYDILSLFVLQYHTKQSHYKYQNNKYRNVEGINLNNFTTNYIRYSL
jgi:hypothetical protein